MTIFVIAYDICYGWRCKIFWPAIWLFAVSFGALHLICCYKSFPTRVELWLWRAAALVWVLSVLVFIHFEKVVLRWGGPLTNNQPRITSDVPPQPYRHNRWRCCSVQGFRSGHL